MKKIMKRICSLLLALVLVAGMLPMTPLTANAVGAAITGTTFREDPGYDFKLKAQFYCFICGEYAYLTTDDGKHEFQFNSFGYTVTQNTIS